MFSWNARRARKAALLLPDLLPNPNGRWADLGCGDGIFTRLLAERLASNATLIAIDQDASALQALSRTLAATPPALAVKTLRADFTQPLSLPPLDGVLMANALHFVSDKQAALRQLTAALAPDAVLLLIEYNATRGNRAVPYPLSAAQGERLLETCGFDDVRVVRRAPSSFLNEMVTLQARWSGG